jgi:hypothetical protein
MNSSKESNCCLTSPFSSKKDEITCQQSSCVISWSNVASKNGLNYVFLEALSLRISYLKREKEKVKKMKRKALNPV